MPTCFGCRNQESFLQIASDRAGVLKERRVTLSFKLGRGGSPPVQELRRSLWRPPSAASELSTGFYCGQCSRPVELEPEVAAYLSDRPATVLDPVDFRADPYVKRIRQATPNAEVFTHEVASRESANARLRSSLDSRLVASLVKQQLDPSKFYSHQASSIDAVLSGKNVVVATSAASGKTLCFNVPVINALVRNPDGKALYMYPTKALAQDQILKILQFDDNYSDEGLGSQKGSFFRFSVGSVRLTIGKYDGSTSDFERESMRNKEHPNILLTNPDMLHQAILRNNGKWSRFLSSLRFVVLDEIHAYKGVFGSNVALVLRRLRKICELNGTRVQFILCSATIGNPMEHARALTGLKEFVVVDKDGSPSQRRQVLMINPPASANDPTTRLEPSTVAVDILSNVLLRDKKAVKTITFGRSRLAVKNMFRFLNARLREDPSTAEVASLTREYTATLTPERREEIGKELAMGNIVTIFSTNALELGIDIGDISAAIAVGYPGSTASLLQEFGRAGRKGEGLGLLIMQNNALEQYYARHPEEFFSKNPEVVKVNPQNEFLLTAHMLCAAYECESFGGLSDTDFPNFFGIEPKEARRLLETEETVYEKLRTGEARLVWKSGQPAYNSLRNPVSKSNFDIVCDSQRVGVMDDGTIIRDLHPGAVWTDQDDQYVVLELDFNNKVARVERRDVDYYTIAIPVDHVDIDETIASQPSQGLESSFGRIRLRRSVFSYKKVYFAGAHKDETSPVGKSLPSVEFPTTASWLSFDLRDIRAPAFASPEKLEGGLHALEHAIVSMLPRYVDCDPNDVSGFSALSHPAVSGKPAIFVYDNFAGGIGLSRTLFDKLPEVLASCVSLIKSCKCKEDGGCPACVQSPRCQRDNPPLSKKNALLLARTVGHDRD